MNEPDPDAEPSSLQVRRTPATVTLMRGGSVVAHATFRPEQSGLHVEMHPEAGHLPVDVRPALLEAVFGHSGLAPGMALSITIPLGDSVLLQGIQRMCSVLSVDSAGSTCLIRGKSESAERAQARRDGRPLRRP